MNLIREKKYVMTKRMLVVVILLFVFFIKVVSQTYAEGVNIIKPSGWFEVDGVQLPIADTYFENKDSVTAAILSETESLSGVRKENGVVIGVIANSNYGKLYESRPESEKAGYLNAMSNLYDNLLPSVTERVKNERHLINQNLTVNQNAAKQKYNEGQIYDSITTFKNDPNVHMDSTADAAHAAAEKKEGQSIQSEEIYCFKWTQGISIPGCIAIGSYFILYLTSWILFVAALAFDWTLQWSLSMYTIIDDFKAIQYGWETLRNVINLFFILILVFISIATILRVENYGYKKLLSKLVIAAFLINFSMFFTKIIIDVSNITAIVFYKQIMVDAEKAAKAGSGGAPGSGAAANSTNQYLSLGIMNALGLQSIWGAVNNSGGAGSMGSKTSVSNDPAVSSGNKIATSGGASGITDPWTMTLVGLGGSVFVLILSFVFFSATIMFLLRIVMLIILIITSPAAFAAKVLPQTSKWSDKWWSQLTSNALFAPVYMILMFVTLKMIWGGSNQTGNNLLALFSNSSGSGIQAIVFFALLCAMLIACLIIAASFGTMGAKMTQSWGKSLGNKAQNYAKSRAFAPVSYIADKASKNKYVGKLVGGMGLQGLDKLAQAKVGGSSYRSRVADDQKTYKTRGDLIKKANTKELMRENGEDEKTFQARKKKEEAKGREAQQAYFGVDKDGVKQSGSFYRGKQLAREDLLDTAGKIKEDPSGKIITRSNENIVKVMNGDFKNALGALGDSERKEIEELIEKTKVDETGKAYENDKAIAKAMTPEKVFEIVAKISRPLEKLNEEITVLDKDMEAVAKRLRTGSGGPSSRDKDRMALVAIQSQIDSKNRKVGAINSAVARLEADANRVQDTNAQSKTRDAIEKNKPEPAK